MINASIFILAYLFLKYLVFDLIPMPQNTPVSFIEIFLIILTKVILNGLIHLMIYVGDILMTDLLNAFNWLIP